MILEKQAQTNTANYNSSRYCQSKEIKRWRYFRNSLPLKVRW